MDITTSPRTTWPQDPPVLACSGLTKAYGTTMALAGIRLAVDAGESVAVMGPSGSGKSTLLHCLAGIIAPDAGQVRLRTPEGDTDVERLDEEGRARLRRERFGFVFQEGLLLPELEAVENVALPLLLSGASRDEAWRRAGSWLQVLGLAGLEGRRPGQMSGGQAQRVAIARSQVADPWVTFADEPTGALDQATSAEVLTALLEATCGRGRTLVVVTHDEQVASRCSRIVRLRDGAVVHDSALALGRDPRDVPARGLGHDAATGTVR